MTGDVNPAALQEFVDRHPDASVPEVLGRFQLNPATYADIVGALLNGEDVDLSADAGEHDLVAPSEDGGKCNEETDGGDEMSAPDSFGDADFTTPERGVWSPERLERRQWMGHVEKKPFAP